MDHTRIHELFDARVAQAPHQPFLFTPEGSLSLGELSEWVDWLQAELLGLGVRAGDRVLVAAENCPEHVALILACSRVGAWACGVNARMSAGELAAFIHKADPRVVYFTANISESTATHARAALARPGVLPGLWHTEPRPASAAQEGALANDVAAVIFTSGTTGQPKGVMVSHAGLLQFAKASSASRALGPQDRSYAYLPMTHIFGLGTVLMASVHAGAGLVMRSRFDPVDVFDALARHGVTQLQGPPTLFQRLLSWLDEQGIERPAAPALRYVYTGAAPMTLPLKQAVEQRFGLPLHHGYGLSEYAGALCVGRLGERRDDTSAGYPVEGAELRIVDAQGQALPAGQTGEIWMRGTGLMPGYFRDPVATAEVMRPGGWYASGDLGRLGDDGGLFVVGRLKDMIIRSGFNVYPVEVESVLSTWPGVARVAVAGHALPDGNEEIVAFIEPEPGVHIDTGALRAHAVAELAPYKRPSHVVFVDALPMTLSGKVLKRELLAGWSRSAATTAA